MFCILLVEDDLSLQEMYKKEIYKRFSNALKVDFAKNEKEAFKKVASGKAFCLIIINVDFADNNALKALVEMKKNSFSMPIIANTSIGLPQIQAALLQGIIDGFILKSSNARNLLILIEKFVTPKNEVY